MEEAVIRFSRAARDADVALFYYSGHAIQFAGVSYLAPVDIQLNDEADLRRMVRVDEVVSDLQQAKNLRILVLDSCGRLHTCADQYTANRANNTNGGMKWVDKGAAAITARASCG
ncbi:MAG TPA: caspase family protein [Bradyrhizobium sp.]|jgi:uncharacterized caspase-like protein